MFIVFLRRKTITKLGKAAPMGLDVCTPTIVRTDRTQLIIMVGVAVHMATDHTKNIESMD